MLFLFTSWCIFCFGRYRATSNISCMEMDAVIDLCTCYFPCEEYNYNGKSSRFAKGLLLHDNNSRSALQLTIFVYMFATYT